MHEDEYVDSSSSRTSDSLLNTKVVENNNINNNTTAPPLVPVVVEEDTTTTTTTNTTMMMMMTTTTTTTEENDRESNHHLNNNHNNNDNNNDNNNSDNNNPAVEESSEKKKNNSNDTNDNDNDNDDNNNNYNSTTPSTQPITENTDVKEPDKTTTTTTTTTTDDDVKMEYELTHSNEKEKAVTTTTIHPPPKDDNTNHNNNNKEDTATTPITNGENHQSSTTTTATIEATTTTSSSNSNSVPLNGAATSTTTTAAAAAATTETTTSTTTTTTAAATAAAAAAALPQPPVMKGTLCIDMVHEQQYRHLIRGMWNYENSTTFPPQRFELLRNLSSDDEDIHTLPVDGEFHGSFSLAYFHTTSKGKQKERSKIIPETGVKIKFIPVVSTTTTDTSKDQNDNNESSSGNNDNDTSTTPIISEYQVEGTGTNQFGIFHIYGTATRNPPLSESDTTPTMSIVFRKRYEPGLPTTTAVTTDTTTTTTTTAMTSTLTKDTTKSQYGDSTSAMITTTNGDGTVIANNTTAGPLPDPAPSFASGIVALRGKLFKEESNDLGTTEVVHRINGTWASGLDYIEADPQNLRGLCNRFEYEHKSAVPTQQFPVSGKYSGWFDLSNEDGTRTRINERDVLLKFRPNNQGYQNVEGKGSNVFGKYTITGTLTEDNIITIFRHFQPRKFKKSTSATNTTLSSLNPDTSCTTTTTTAVVSNVTSSTTESNSMVLSSSSSATNVRRSMTNPTDFKLSLEDVKIPTGSTNGTDGDDTEPYDPIVPPVSGTYSAVSRGVLRINDDGSHSCQGKWAATREHFTNGQTSNFTFRLEPHFVVQESTNQTGGGGNGEKVFPLDSAMYKGSFQLKKQASRYQTIIDQQIVMKFRRNKHGAYNVHGTGINAIGEFNLLGTLVTSGKTGGQVELYRMYPPEKLAVQPAVATTSSVIPKPESTVGSMGSTLPKGTNSAVSAVSATGLSSTSGKQQQQQNQMQRRESSRMSKLPSRLEEDDPDAQLSRTMDKCLQILKFMRERDVELGAFFSEPVDPIALGIPTYVHIIKEPMDLRTIENKMNAGSVQTPEEFSRLVRLVFENAMTFNVDPGHSVHQAARSLLVIFNQKFRDVERMVQSIRRAHGIDVDETGKPRGKDDKKRKRQEEPKSMKRIRIEEAQAMTTANAAAVSAIVAAMPTSNVATVSRNEFSLLLNLVQQLQQQVVQTHLAVAELCPGDANDEAGGDTIRSNSGHDTSKTNASSTGEKKKAVKRKADVMEESYVPPVETSLPLTEKEQELMMETINAMSQEHLGGVLEIIRETALVDENDDVIDLGIDQLDDATQRKLFRHIQVYLKKTKAKPKKKMKTNPPQPPPKKVVEKAPPPKKPQAAPKPKQAASSDSFFRFGQKNGSDSDDDSDDDDNNGATYRSNANAGGKQISSFAGADDFNLGDGLDLADDNDEDNTEIPVNWGDISNQNATGSNKKDNDDEEEDDDDDNDDWGKVAREQAAIAKARDAARRAREEKKKAEAEQASRIRLAEAAHRGEEIKAQRAEDEAKEATLREQQEREAEAARQKAKNAARAQLSSLQQTVDLDAQRDIMKQYDFDSKDLGGASPSSDFGF